MNLCRLSRLISSALILALILALIPTLKTSLILALIPALIPAKEESSTRRTAVRHNSRSASLITSVSR